MDSFEHCRKASERATWSFEKEIGALDFDPSCHYLPERICGRGLPDWMDEKQRLLLNQIRGFSYAHLFMFVEQFIIEETCAAAGSYIHSDRDALSALLKFTEEETKHQRMFIRVKELASEGLGFSPAALSGMQEVAREVCRHSSFAVFLVTLNIEWFTQRHYIECFQEEKGKLDPGYMKVFRLHWTEEAQHARIDALQLRRLAAELTDAQILGAVEEFIQILFTMRKLIFEQDELDVASFEEGIGRSLSSDERASLLKALNASSTWTYILSGLEHRSFRAHYEELVPATGPSIDDVHAQLADLGD